MSDARSIGPSLALVAYAESLIVGRKVIVFGDACSPLAEALVERGARLVHVCDPDPPRVAEGAARNRSNSITYAPLGEGGLGGRDGSFDVAIVENLPALSQVDGLLRRVRRALSARGLALISSPNPECETRLVADATSGPIPDYYGLYDQVAGEFAEVRMAGQAPLVGYTVADFAPEGDPEPTFDNGFVPGGAEEPERFLAVASAGPIAHAEFVVVGLPAAAVLENRLGEAQEAELQARIAELEAELERQTARRADERKPDLSAELEKRDRWIRALEARADTADERADAAESELESLREQAERSEAEKSALADRIQGLELELGERKTRIVELNEALAAEEKRRDLGEAEAQSAEDLSRLERQLGERGQQIQRLERQLADAQRLGRELVAKLEAHEPGLVAVESLKRQLDNLAELNAEREADLQAARWNIQSLEFELGRLPGEDSPTGEVRSADAS
jgi:hypothetical protein